MMGTKSPAAVIIFSVMPLVRLSNDSLFPINNSSLTSYTYRAFWSYWIKVLTGVNFVSMAMLAVALELAGCV